MDNKEVILEGIEAPGMPSYEEEFKRVTGEDFDPDKYEVEWTGAENYGEDDTYTPYRIVRKQIDIDKAYRNVVENAVALMTMPSATDPKDKRNYDEEYLRRTEEMNKFLKHLSPELIKKAEDEINRRLESNKKNKYSNMNDEQLNDRLRDLSEMAGGFADEMSEDDPLAIEYFEILDELNKRKQDKVPEKVEVVNSKLSNMTEEELNDRLRELSEIAGGFADEMSEDDPLAIEYFEILDELNKRKQDKVPEKVEVVNSKLSNKTDEELNDRLRELAEIAIGFADEMTEDHPLAIEYFEILDELNRRKQQKEKVVEQQKKEEEQKKNENVTIGKSEAEKKAIAKQILDNVHKQQYDEEQKKTYVEPALVIYKPVSELTDEELEEELEQRRKEDFEISFDNPIYRRYLELESEKARRDGNKLRISVPSDDEITTGLANYIKPEEKTTNDKDDDFDKKVDDYFKKRKGEVTPKRRERHAVVRTRRSRIRFWPVVVSAVMTIAAAVGLGGKKNTDVEVQKNLSSDFSVSRQIEVPEYQDIIVGEVPIQVTPEDDQTIIGLSTGDKTTVPEGLDYHESSWWRYDPNPERQGVFGSEIRPAGEYTIDYISIFHNGVNKKVEYRRGQNIQDTVTKVARELGVSEKDLDVYVCITGPDSGWIDYNQYIQEMSKAKGNPEYEKQYIHSQIRTGTTVKYANPISGTSDDFNGVIKFKDEKGNDTMIDLRKEDKSLYTVGDVVKASNGESYRIDKLSIDEHVTGAKTIKTEDKKLNWSLSNINGIEALAIAAVSLIGVPLTYRRRDEEDVMTESELYNLVGIGDHTPSRSPSWDFVDRDFDWHGLTVDSEKISYDFSDENGEIGFRR